MRWPCSLACGRAYSELEAAERHEARCDGTPPKRRGSMDPVAVPRPAVTTRGVEARHEAAHQRALIARLGGGS